MAKPKKSGGSRSGRQTLIVASPNATPQKSVDFHYIKSNHHRTIDVDGAIGGPTPRGGRIAMTVFSERLPIPVLTSQEVSDHGVLGKELSRTARQGIVREVEATLIFDIEIAKKLSTWINARITQIEKLQRKAK